MTRLALTAASLAVILAGLMAVLHVALAGGAS